MQIRQYVFKNLFLRGKCRHRCFHIRTCQVRDRFCCIGPSGFVHRAINQGSMEITPCAGYIRLCQHRIRLIRICRCADLLHPFDHVIDILHRTVSTPFPEVIYSCGVLIRLPENVAVIAIDVRAPVGFIIDISDTVRQNDIIRHIRQHRRSIVIEECISHHVLVIEQMIELVDFRRDQFAFRLHVQELFAGRQSSRS